MMISSVIVQPALSEWKPAFRSDQDRSQLVDRVNENAGRLGTGRMTDSARIIASGHQASLWHPGILAKYIAMHHACRLYDASPLNLVVDHDVYDPLHIPYPQKTGDRLAVRHLELGHCRQYIPPGMHDPVDLSVLRRQVNPLFKSIVDAAENLPDCQSLAEQFAVLITRLISPLTGVMPVLFVSDLPTLSMYRSFVNGMIEDAHHCACSYNAALKGQGQWQIARLAVRDHQIELPLWAVSRNQPRRRVFLRTSDHCNNLVFDTGQAMDADIYNLLPRAMTLTAFMRMYGCDFFIHGLGGGEYDKVTDTWINNWRGGRPAPFAVVTADMYLERDVPVADRSDFAKAVWYRHHLPHNIDRHVRLDVSQQHLADRKHQLIKHMKDDRNRKRKQNIYREIKEINRLLMLSHPGAIRFADDQLARVRIGLANRDIAGRRDWPFPFYTRAQLNMLAEQIRPAACCR